MDKEIMEQLQLIVGFMENMSNRMDSLDAKVDGLQEQVTGMQVFLENEIDRKLTALHDGHTQRIDIAGEEVQDVESSVLALEILTRKNLKDINKLKAKVG